VDPSNTEQAVADFSADEVLAALVLTWLRGVAYRRQVDLSGTSRGASPDDPQFHRRQRVCTDRELDLVARPEEAGEEWSDEDRGLVRQDAARVVPLHLNLRDLSSVHDGLFARCQHDSSNLLRGA